METVKLTIEVPKESHEFLEAMANFVATAAKEIKDNGGYSAGDDLPGIIVAALALIPALAGLMSISAEAKEHTQGFVVSLSLAVGKMTSALMAD